MSANNRQVGGSHYSSSAQHWDFVKDQGIGYFAGQVTKYLFRWRKKGGLQDVEKAEHFLQKMGEKRNPHPVTFEAFVKVNKVPPLETKVMLAVLKFERTGKRKHFKKAVKLVRELAAEAAAELP